MGPLPHWCTALPDAETMRAIDRWAIEQRGVPSLELMERAGEGVARAAEQLAPDGPVTVVCGKGNNGADGLVAARLLRHAGRAVTVLTVSPPAELRGDARVNLERLPGDPPAPLAAGAALPESAVVIDALLGTGFTGEPHGAVAEAIDAVNAAAAPALSVDVPSGVDASTGMIAGRAVRAALTVTFHAAKPGLWIHPGKACAGEVRTIDIGIPRGAPTGLLGSSAPATAAAGPTPSLPAAIGLIDVSVCDELPSRGAASTKFSSGHVLVVGGSRGLSGAPRMAAEAAMRAGAGYVTACVPDSLQAVLAAGGLPELMTMGLPEEDGALSPAAVATVLAATERGGALALGPGLGRAPGACAAARELVQRATVATVLDADGLNAHAGRLGELAGREAPLVLTPHAGELARLLELSSEQVERERLLHVRAAAALADAVVVLKGDDTLIADPSGRVLVNPGASPALATAGTGDVLTGVLAALLAQGLDALTAAAAGVWMHAAAGRAAAQRLGAAEGVIASDVIAALPAARSGAGAR
jgi:ADP-dependent NAD(P)H-hydrate dehydratase / NAD(P)H-hydrate epimerase